MAAPKGRNRNSPWSGRVVATPEYEVWFGDQDERIKLRLIALQQELAYRGPSFGRPHSGLIKGNFPVSMRELIIKNPAIRVLYTFDSQGSAVLLMGADKTHDWKAWYEPAVKEATKIYDSYVQNQLTIAKGARK